MAEKEGNCVWNKIEVQQECSKERILKEDINKVGDKKQREKERQICVNYLVQHIKPLEPFVMTYESNYLKLLLTFFPLLAFHRQRQ